MISKIALSNFKCFKNIKLELSPMTLFSGLNSCGKSTIYQSLLLLQQSEDSEIEINGNIIPILKLNGPIVQMGKQDEILNSIDNKAIGISLETIDGLNIKFQFILSNVENALEYNEYETGYFILSECSISYNDYSYYIRIDNSKISLKSKAALRFDDQFFEEYLFDYLNMKAEKNGIKMDKYKYLSEFVEFDDIDNIEFYHMFLKSFELNIAYAKNCIKNKYHKLFDAEEFNTYLQSKEYDSTEFCLQSTYLRNLIRELNIQKKVIFIPPFRGYPKRVYIEIDEPNPLVLYKRHINNQFNYSYSNGKEVSGSLKKAINYWMSKIVGETNGFNVNNLVDGLISETMFISNKRNISINNVGFGISQILPMILKVLLAPRDSLCIVDEPEVHLHPAIQSRLTEFFYTMSMLGKHLIIETHSEYIINKSIYYKIKYENNIIDLYWIIKKRYQSYVNKIEHDHLGFIVNKPIGFLDESDKIVELLSVERSNRL